MTGNTLQIMNDTFANFVKKDKNALKPLTKGKNDDNIVNVEIIGSLNKYIIY